MARRRRGGGGMRYGDGSPEERDLDASRDAARATARANAATAAIGRTTSGSPDAHYAAADAHHAAADAHGPRTREMTTHIEAARAHTAAGDRAASSATSRGHGTDHAASNPYHSDHEIPMRGGKTAPVTHAAGANLGAAGTSSEYYRRRDAVMKATANGGHPSVTAPMHMAAASAARAAGMHDTAAAHEATARQSIAHAAPRAIHAPTPAPHASGYARGGGDTAMLHNKVVHEGRASQRVAHEVGHAAKAPRAPAVVQTGKKGGSFVVSASGKKRYVRK